MSEPANGNNTLLMPDRHWNSTKLFVTLLAQAIAGWMGHEDSLQGVYLCVSLTAPVLVFLTGQSGIDAVKAFAIAKYAK